MDDFIGIMSEEDLENLLQILDDVLPKTSGPNISTSLYGLFLCGLELSDDESECKRFRLGIEYLSQISYESFERLLGLRYPVEDISLRGILRLVNVVEYIGLNCNEGTIVPKGEALERMDQLVEQLIGSVVVSRDDITNTGVKLC